MDELSVFTRQGTALAKQMVLRRRISPGMGAPAWVQTLSSGPEHGAGEAQLQGRGEERCRELGGHPWEQDLGLVQLCQAVLGHPMPAAELSQFPAELRLKFLTWAGCLKFL